MWQLDAIATFFLSVAGLAFASLDIYKMWFSLDQKTESGDKLEYDPKLLKCVIDMLEKDANKYDIILKDYEVCQAEIARRDNSTLLIGSIFTTASLLILANTISHELRNSLFIYAFASIMLFLLWLLLVHRTGNKLDNITYKRTRTIEEALACWKSGYQFGLHSYIWRKTHKEGKTFLWLRRRRSFWSIILMLISFAWMFLAMAILGRFSVILIIDTILMIMVFLAVYCVVRTSRVSK
jgi:hypothetical protein